MTNVDINTGFNIKGSDNMTEVLVSEQAGWVGMRTADHNEHHFFSGRFIERIKLVGGEK